MTASKPRRHLWRTSALAAAAVTALVAAASAQAAPSWSDGQVVRTSATNCTVLGHPFTEEASWSWVGQYADANDLPGPNQTWYGHAVVGAVGSPCGIGGVRAHIEATLPPATQLAITPQTPVFCWYAPPGGGPAISIAQNCAQNPSLGSNGYDFDPVGDPMNPVWPLATGAAIEIQFPVRSAHKLQGIFANPCDCLGAASQILDGQSSPQVFPQQGVFVGAGPGGGGGVPGGTGGTKPGTGPAPGSAALGSVLVPATFKIRKAGKGGVPVDVENRVAGSTIDVALLSGSPSLDRLRAGAAKRKVLGKARRKNAAKGLTTIKVKLNKKARKKFKRKRKVKVTVQITVTPPTGKGKAVSAQRALTLKR